MNSPANNQSSLSDPERTGHRSEIYNQLFRGLLLVNSGGIIALFAYLQAIPNKIALSKVILVGVFLLSLSMLFSLLFMQYRYLLSEQDQFKKSSVLATKKREVLYLNFSIGLLFAALLEIIVGSLCLL
ncbi:MAG: hypothetical protein QNK31_13595 [Porticoccus sp.]|nr:hypothetical protein [Porticoccus sp.]